jgi:hypothetical protein
MSVSSDIKAEISNSKSEVLGVVMKLASQLRLG